MQSANLILAILMMKFDAISKFNTSNINDAFMIFSYLI